MTAKRIPTCFETPLSRREPKRSHVVFRPFHIAVSRHSPRPRHHIQRSLLLGPTPVSLGPERPDHRVHRRARTAALGVASDRNGTSGPRASR